MYAHCDGVDYTMLFDAKSFILDKQFPIDGSDQTYTGFALKKKISFTEIDPWLVQNVNAIGNSISIVSKNETIANVGQSVATYYEDSDKGTKWPENLQIYRRKTHLASSQQVTQSWGTSFYQLYHTRSTNDEEEIKVYKYKNDQL